ITQTKQEIDTRILRHLLGGTHLTTVGRLTSTTIEMRIRRRARHITNRGDHRIARRRIVGLRHARPTTEQRDGGDRRHYPHLPSHTDTPWESDRPPTAGNPLRGRSLASV